MGEFPASVSIAIYLFIDFYYVGAVLSGKTEAGLQKIEVFLDSDYVDVSSESAYARIKDTLKLMQRIKVCFQLVPIIPYAFFVHLFILKCVMELWVDYKYCRR